VSDCGARPGSNFDFVRFKVHVPTTGSAVAAETTAPPARDRTNPTMNALSIVFMVLPQVLIIVIRIAIGN
jgi:hypothetical protein